MPIFMPSILLVAALHLFSLSCRRRKKDWMLSIGVKKLLPVVVGQPVPIVLMTRSFLPRRSIKMRKKWSVHHLMQSLKSGSLADRHRIDGKG